MENTGRSWWQLSKNQTNVRGSRYHFKAKRFTKTKEFMMAFRTFSPFEAEADLDNLEGVA